MGFFRQTWVLVGASLRSLPKRFGTAIVTVIGVTTVVAVFVSFLALEGGLNAMIGTARPNVVDVLRHGAQGVPSSVLSRQAVNAIRNAPGVRHAADGSPYVAVSVLATTSALSRNGVRRTLSFSGETPGLWLVNDKLKIVNGRRYRPGFYELIVPKAIQASYQGFEVGDHITLQGKDWTVVGAFTTPSAIGKSVLHADAAMVMQAFGLNHYTVARVELISPAAMGAFKDALTDNSAIHVDVKPEKEVMHNTFGSIIGLISFAAYFIGIIMAFGAVCGALNSLYASIDARERELATLRAVGYRGSAVMASVLVEGMLIALPGAFIGAGIAWLLFNGHQTSVGSFVLDLGVDAHALWVSVVWALVIGLIGASLPALRVTRRSVANGLRAA